MTKVTEVLWLQRSELDRFPNQTQVVVTAALVNSDTPQHFIFANIKDLIELISLLETLSKSEIV